MSEPLDIDQVVVTNEETVEVFLATSPEFADVAALKRRLMGIAGVVRVVVQPGRQNMRLSVFPANPVDALSLLTTVKNILNPQRSINVHLYFGPLSAATEFTGEFICVAVEFVKPVPEEGRVACFGTHAATPYCKYS